MRTFLKTLLWICITVGIVGLHMAISFIAPFPFDTFNVIFCFLVLYILFYRSGAVVWVSFLLHYIIDLYSVSTFGVVLFAGTISALCMYWISKNIFANVSISVALGLTAIGLLLYRGIFSALLILLSVFGSTEQTQLFENRLFIIYLWEIGITSLASMFMYVIIQKYVKGKSLAL